ncbi:unnamed protein product [Meganyctiphanes norvegica]|uniref:PiggyBac transposable element-derived protein domain-containing protein n=1 Tax=Meganyctiphanes norvegica TaxID=48144 RepID=A0AAV2RII9_MEGNR
MSLIKLPRTRYYWNSEVEIPAVSQYMRMRRWEKIKHFLHFSDNEKVIEKGQPGYDRIYKIRPLLDLLNSKFNEIDLPEHVSCDEMIIPYAGTRGPRQYVKGKPNPWGFKVWCLADTHGVIHNVDLCVEPTPAQDGHPDIGSTGNLVLKLCSIVPRHENYKVYMDNYFSGVPLFLELRRLGIHCMGTVQLPRASGLKSVLIPDHELIKKGKSSFVEYEGKLDNKGKDLRVVRWNDGKIVNIMSSFGSALPLGTCERWQRTVNDNKKVSVPCPSLVSYYNTHMGGIDKMDSLLGFYRIFLEEKNGITDFFFILSISA